MTALSAFVTGLVFGIGLILSEMVNPARVQGFLDWFGAWDPTLAFVMAGALTVTFPAMYFLKQRTEPVFAPKFEWPSRVDIDRNLVLGSAMFGVGWGITGFCPGPTLVASSSLQLPVLLFLLCMLAGMQLHKLFATD